MPRLPQSERKVNTHLYMPMHLLDRVDEIADELQTSRSALIIEALEQWLERREEQK